MSGELLNIDLESLQGDINALINTLDSIERGLVSNIMPEITDEAGNMLLAEEKRILSESKYSKFQSLLSVKKTRSDKRWSVKVGYDTAAIRAHIEVLIIEFGRPGRGKKALKKHGKDSLGRRIGAVQPYSHIRAAHFNMKDKIYDMAEDKLYERIKEKWQEN